MTREETLDWLYRLRSEIYVYMPREWLAHMHDALEMAIKALEQPASDDCVSRQAVLNTLFYKSDNNCEVVLNKELRDRIKALPPVTPTRNQEPILDKIRVEIEYLHDWAFSREEILRIIDKYKAESEDKE